MYKILHLPTATLVRERIMPFARGEVPLLSFEVERPEDEKNYCVSSCETRHEAEKLIDRLIHSIKNWRAAYKAHPEKYGCTLHKRFYTIIKEEPLC